MSSDWTSEAPTRRRYTERQKADAVRMVRLRRQETGERYGSVKAVASQLGFGVESVRIWVNQADIDDGMRPGVSSDEAARIKALEQENRELRRSNEILRRASAFFAAELDRPQR